MNKLLSYMLAATCLISFNGLFCAANEHESIEKINQCYEATQPLQSSSSNSNSNIFEAWDIFLSDDADSRKRTERNKDEEDLQDKASKRPCTLERSGELVSQQDRPLPVPLPDFKTFIIEILTGSCSDEFKETIHQKLCRGDFKTTHNLTRLLPLDQRVPFFIKIKGKDSQDILCLSPYIATRYSNIFKNRCLLQSVSTTYLHFKNTPLSALHKMIRIFHAISKAETTPTLTDNRTNELVKFITSEIFIDKTPETLKALFEAANVLRVVPVVKHVLALSVLATIRQYYNCDFDQFNILSEHDKKFIAKTSFMQVPYYAGPNRKNFQKEDLWRSEHHTVSVSDYAPHIRLGLITCLFLDQKNITSPAGLSDIRNVARIKKLNLSNNRLSTLPAYALKGLINLETLDISKNPLEDIDPAMLDHVPRLTTLIIYETPFAKKKYHHTYIRNTFQNIWGKKLRILRK